MSRLRRRIHARRASPDAVLESAAGKVGDSGAGDHGLGRRAAREQRVTQAPLTEPMKSAKFTLIDARPHVGLLDQSHYPTIAGERGG